MKTEYDQAGAGSECAVPSYTLLPIEGHYDFISSVFSDGLSSVVNEDGSCGYIDRTGKLTIPMEYRTPVEKVTVDDGETYYRFDLDPDFVDGIACVSDKNGKFGYINTKGECVIPFVFDEAEPLSFSYAKVRRDGRYAYIDRRGEIIFWFDEIERDENPEELLLFDGELICVIRDGKLGYVNTRGETVIPFIYDDPWKYGYPSFFSDGLLPVRLNRKWGYINEQGQTVIAPTLEYDRVRHFSFGVAVVESGEYEDIEPRGGDTRAERRQWIKRRRANMRCGMIDMTGRLAVPAEYTQIWGGGENGHFLAERGDEYFIIDAKGAVVSAIDGYDFVTSMCGYLRAERDGTTALLDYDGNTLIPPHYENVIINVTASGVRAIVTDKESGKYGVIDLNGNVIVPLDFDTLGPFDRDGYTVAERDGKRYILHIGA